MSLNCPPAAPGAFERVTAALQRRMDLSLRLRRREIPWAKPQLAKSHVATLSKSHVATLSNAVKL